MTTNYHLLLRLTAPAIIVAITALLVLVLDLSMRGTAIAARLRAAVAAACAGCVVAAGVLVAAPTAGGLPGGMIVITPLTQLIQITLLMLTVMVLLLTVSARFTTHIGEYCALVLFATTAMLILVSTQNLLHLFIAIEFLSLSLYLLTAFDKQSRASAEAGLKYFLFGGVSAGMLLFGISLLYGFSGSLALETIAADANRMPGDPLLTMALVMVTAGFGFKVAAAPFHFWAPEVYQGAPTVSASVVAAGSKVASFIAFFVVVYALLPTGIGSAPWAPMRLFGLLAATSMIWGNFAAIAQSSVRRLLAYSAVGHAGYMVIALVVHSAESESALVYYVITYALATVGTFGVLSAFGAADGLGEFVGFSRRAPGMSFCLAIFLLSLAGVPPLAGFFGKFYLFVTAWSRAGSCFWLVILALATSVVSFYYYLKILKQIYVVEPTTEAMPLPVPASTRIVVWAAAALIILLGCWPQILLNRMAVGP